VNKGKNQTTSYRVGIQGGIGSFHHEAICIFLKNTNFEPIPFDSFTELFGALEDDKLDYAAVAVENSIAGFIHTNYGLLENSNATIIDELYLPIKQCLMVTENTTIENIQEIHSHPMAILQCLDYLKAFRQKGVKLVETIDTAESAKLIAERRMDNVAVIASTQAAEIYGLKIVSEHIESSDENITRFTFIQKKQTTDKNTIDQLITRRKKVTACVTFEHVAKEMPSVLNILSNNNSIDLKVILQLMNTSKFEGHKFLFEFSVLDEQSPLEILKSIKNLGLKTKIIGIYDSSKC
jgi:prephenate dehydratase